MAKVRRKAAYMVGTKNPGDGAFGAPLDPSQVPIAVDYAPTAFVGAAEAVDATAQGLPWYMLVGAGVIAGWFAYSWWYGGTGAKVMVAKDTDTTDSDD